jgi:rare lipoprotein A
MRPASPPTADRRTRPWPIRWGRVGRGLAFAATVAAGALLVACGTRPPAPPVGPGPAAPAPTPRPAPEAPAARHAETPLTIPPPPLARAPYPGPDGPDPHPPAGLLRVPNAVPRVEPLRTGSPNVPYAIKGQTYRPRPVDEPVRQVGVASWYGRKFHGQRTASGEVYNMYAMTAAHPTLPIPSYARVRNRNNGREVIVRVNDRGPFHAGRILDLSYTAALKLGFVKNQGTAPVELERLTHEAIRTGSWRNPQLLADPPSGGGLGWDLAGLDGLLGLDPAASLTGAPLGRDAFSPLARPLWLRHPVDGAGADPLGEAAPTDPAGPAAAQGPTDPATATADAAWWLQLGPTTRTAEALARQQQAHRRDPALAPLLAVVSVPAVSPTPGLSDRAALLAGPFPTRDEARAAAQRLAPKRLPNEALRLLQRP